MLHVEVAPDVRILYEFDRVLTRRQDIERPRHRRRGTRAPRFSAAGVSGDTKTAPPAAGWRGQSERSERWPRRSPSVVCGTGLRPETLGPSSRLRSGVDGSFANAPRLV